MKEMSSISDQANDSRNLICIFTEETASFVIGEFVVELPITFTQIVEVVSMGTQSCEAIASGRYSWLVVIA